MKLFGTQRHSHVMSAVLDEGLALFAGLNVIPKRSFLTEYSCRLTPACYPRLMRHWFDAMNGLGLQHGRSFDLDFSHDSVSRAKMQLVEKHYVSKPQPATEGNSGLFGPKTARKRFFCYAPTAICGSRIKTMRSCNSSSSGKSVRVSCPKN